MEVHERGNDLDGIGWALFFVWVGLAWFLDLGWGAGLLGIAAITLGVQAARRVTGLALEWFWVVVGLVFAVAGTWELLDVQRPLAPLLLVLLGVIMLISAFYKRKG